MRTTALSTMALTALVSGLAVWVVFDLALETLRGLLTVPITVPIAMAGMAVAILCAGWPVHQYVLKKRRHIDPLRAATILALGKACTLTGSALTGAYVGILLHTLQPVGGRARIWQAVIALVAALILAVAGRIVEWMCRLPPDDEAGSQNQAAAPPSRGKAGPDPNPA